MLLSLSYTKNTHLDVIQKKRPTFGKAQQFDPFFYQQLIGLFQKVSKSTKTQNWSNSCIKLAPLTAHLGLYCPKETGARLNFGLQR